MNVINFVRWSRQLPSPETIVRPGSIWLEWRNWDDYGWKVMFNAFVPIGGRWVDLGFVSIAVIDKETGEPHSNTWTALGGGDTPPPPISELDADWCASLGAGLDYYQWFVQNDSVDLLVALADLAYPGAARVRWERFDVLRDAFLRSTNAKKAYEEATALILGKRPELADLTFKYRLEFTTEQQSVELTVPLNPMGDVPRRVHVVIGPNGSGKTTLLFNLARDFATVDRDQAKARFLQLPVRRISRQVLVTNNPFDAWRLPDARKKYGLSIVGLSYANDELRQFVEDFNGDEDEWLEWLTDRFPAPEDLLAAISNAVKDPDKQELRLLADERQDWSRVLDGIITGDALEELIERPEEAFSSLSAGQKSIILILAGLAGRLDQESLVLIDEPETHLHPHFLSLFSRALHELLSARNSFAIIATHSPLVLREVPSDAVTVLWRDGDRRARARSLGMQSIGATIPALTADVFGVEPLVGHWVDVLQPLVGRLGRTAVLGLFDPPLEPEVAAILKYWEEEDA